MATMTSTEVSFPLNTWVTIVAEEAVDKPISTSSAGNFSHADAYGNPKAMEFDYTRLIVRDNAGKHYKARYAKEIWMEPCLRASLLTDVKELDLSKLELDMGPDTLVNGDLTVCPAELAADTNVVFIKKPSMNALFSEKEMEETKELFLQEARVAQALSESPHPGLATYYGIVLSEAGKLIGLAYRRYHPWNIGTQCNIHSTLSCFIDLVDSGIDVSRTPIASPDFVSDLVEAVEHMHLLGYVHNDIKPDNIMFDCVGRPVLIDFDSARPTGAEFGLKVGTPGYADENATCTEERNDWFALKWTLEDAGIVWEMPEDNLCEQCGRSMEQRVRSPVQQGATRCSVLYCTCQDALGLGISGLSIL